VTAEGLPDADRVLARAGEENFPVALRLLPLRQRRHLLALYGFARLVDDAADEAPGDRDALLDAIERDLARAFAGGAPRHPLLARLAPSVRALDLPRAPFERLLEAGRRDQRVHRYATWAALEGQCALSANPVGELVLHVFGAATPERVALSDRICTGLQLVEHLQDVGEDAARDRVYLPQEDLVRFGCREAELRGSRAGPALRAVVGFEAARARALLDEGSALVARLRGRARIAVAGFAAGGRAARDAIEAAGGDVLSAPRRPRRAAWARHWVRALVAAPRARRSGAPAVRIAP